ncbi:hypothetical protein ACM46_21785 [Chryseobacterium angstadtii]|uniref:Uncharacterized protein n=1 Tax=Chryseobacterium angstadtii TaxID=558151 RepID=A0A0J7HY73_9FLAO|nr:hypothetical protein [Chryseobacterium angstadtii]KMQ58654.1 hypothetical protein ACM46_21785 [Chryseobacterium angstadtii]
MKKIFITLLTALLIATLVFFINKDQKDTPNYRMFVLPFALIFSIPLMKFLFPVTRELKIGTSEFYPNLFRKTAEFFRNKRSSH